MATKGGQKSVTRNGREGAPAAAHTPEEFWTKPATPASETNSAPGVGGSRRCRQGSQEPARTTVVVKDSNDWLSA